MQSLRDILRDRLFWMTVAGLWALQFVGLLLSTPLYDIDTNSYIRGGLSWDIYHNPLLNILIALCSKVWSNAWFIIGVQLSVFAFSAGFLARVLFGRGKWIWGALAWAAIEPLTLYYNYSFLSESLFLSFTLLAVAFFVLWMRHSGGAPAFLTGFAMGLAFAAKLSALTHAPLLLLFLLRLKRPRSQRVEGFALALLPFAGLYALVFVGQTLINQGDLYTVEGRVRWDFSSSMYDSTEVEGDQFKRYVHPYLYRGGQFVEHRELRRELTYLGYKDCVADYERQGFTDTYGINTCDSLFGAVAAQIMKKHFWEAESQFVKDNFHFIHSLNYIDYRFTPGLHYYYPESEFNYIDSLMATHYGVDLRKSSHRIPRVWTSMEFGNVYMPLVWWTWWVALGAAVLLWFHRKDAYELLVMAPLLSIPIVFHLIYISYRPRFLAPYLVLLGMMVIWEIRELWKLRKGAS